MREISSDIPAQVVRFSLADGAGVRYLNVADAYCSIFFLRGPAGVSKGLGGVYAGVDSRVALLCCVLSPVFQWLSAIAHSGSVSMCRRMSFIHTYEGQNRAVMRYTRCKRVEVCVRAEAALGVVGGGGQACETSARARGGVRATTWLSNRRK